MKVIKLTKKLISIPSYVGSSSNEKKLGEFLYQYLKKFRWLSVAKQPIENGRFNVFAKDLEKTKLLIIGHIDTVNPTTGWNTDPFKPKTKGKKLFGLGASDMKGGLAAVLAAIEKAGPTKGLAILFYVDEEYDFKGTQKFIAEYAKLLKPDLILSADSDNLEFGLGCRGLIEITFQIEGKAGHAATPKNGINAIDCTYSIVAKIKKSLTKYTSNALGKSTCNLAFLQGGQALEKSKTKIIKIGREGNIIPDYAECVVDVRTASPKLNAEQIVRLIKKEVIKRKCKLIGYKIRHDYGAWITDKSAVKQVVSLVKKPRYTKPNTRGYVDLQMFWEAFSYSPCITYGPGEPGTSHQANEYVDTAKLIKAQLFYEKLIKKMVG